MKRIVTCCDGTWNKPGQTDQGVITQTNVLKLSHLVCNRDASNILQLTHYLDGVGTSGNWLKRQIGGVTGEGLDYNIIKAYKFIVLNYEVGDQNFLFGFSRGAYTARSLGGFIINCGILMKHHVDRIGEAFALYRERKDDSNPNSDRAKTFRALYSHPPAVYFIGVWDTVGDMGIPLRSFQLLNSRLYKFHDTQLSSHVPYAYHALATDEHRSVFNATLWQRSAAGKANPLTQNIEQVWFSGAHSNVGGGYEDHGLSDHALEWMICKAQAAGLAFNTPISGLAVNVINGELIDSATFLYRLLNYFRPFCRLISLGDPVFVDQSVATSVAQRIGRKPGYLPANLPAQQCMVSRLQIQDRVILTVNAVEFYSACVLEVGQGEQYQFDCAPGQVWKDASIASGPDGFFNWRAWLIGLRVKDVKCFCLCGLYDKDEGSSFVIGSSNMIVAARSGYLYFFANDSIAFYGNNSGSINVQITRLL